MNKINKDKILTILATGLLGYYLSISLFRGLIWSFLFKVLPPINNRHLPQIYIGLLGGAVGIALGYLLFLKFIEKKTFHSGKKHYLAALVLMIIAPVAIAGVFRSHAVNFVEKAEHTIPTSIRITEESPDSSIMFETGKDSASGLAKQFVPKEEDWQNWGKWISQLQLEKTIDGKEYDNKRVATLWINYSVNKKWYSKILNFDGEFFSEEAGNEQIALYKSPELVSSLKDTIGSAKDVEQYKRAVIVNVDTIKDKEKQIEISGDDFKELISFINNENQIKPDFKTLERFKSFNRRGGIWVPKEEKDVYGIYLYSGTDAQIATENFMIYDRQTGILKFEDHYYRYKVLTGYRPIFVEKFE